MTSVEQQMRFGPPAPTARREYVAIVAAMLDATKADPEKVADWIVREIEKVGASDAEPVFDMEGAGPICSWCGSIWPLCGHAVMSEALDEPSTVQGWWTE